MSDIISIHDSILEIFNSAQIDVVRYFLEQARRYSKYKYLSLDIFGSMLVVCCADKECETTVLNPFYDGTNEEE